MNTSAHIPEVVKRTVQGKFKKMQEFCDTFKALHFLILMLVNASFLVTRPKH